MTNNAKPNGFETEIDKAANVFEAMLTPEEEQEAKVEEQEVEATELEAEAEDEVIDEVEVDETEDNETEEEVEDDEAEESVDDQVEDNELDQPQVYTVKVDGVEQEVTEDELVKGYSRNSDYTRKTQELAKERNEFQSTKESVEAEREELKVLLPRLKEVLKQGLGPEPDWDSLKETDQIQYLTEKADWEERLAKVNAVQGEIDRVDAEEKEKLHQQMVSQIEEGRSKLAEKIPEWNDDKVAAEERAEMTKYVQEIGFTPEEVGAVTDWRLVLLMRDGMLYRKQSEIVKKKPTQAKSRTKVARAGSSNNRKPSTTRLKKARQQVAKSGKISDAAKVFEQII